MSYPSLTVNLAHLRENVRTMQAICALGKQDFDPEITTPCDPGVIILGASSDHLMLDVTDSEKTYRIGDCVDLELGYFSTMRAFTSNLSARNISSKRKELEP